MGLKHGGQLREAAHRFGGPLSEWLDLSTGINPNGWPVPPLPTEVWNRLPELTDELPEAARDYYGCDTLLTVAGSQQAIELLPNLRQPTTIALPADGYTEHEYAWRRAGHQIHHYPVDAPEQAIGQAEIMLVINPHNPSAERYQPARLLDLHQQLAADDGWLIVDEAFIDLTPDQSLASYLPRPGLILLRSLGKFFGLAGVRCGFVLAEEQLLQKLMRLMPPWSVSHPARWVARHALKDTRWQSEARNSLHRSGERLQQLLTSIDNQCRSAGLFATLTHPNARHCYSSLARQGILIRDFENSPRLRIGLPATENDWDRLERALLSLTTKPNLGPLHD